MKFIAITRTVGRTSLLLKKHGPTIAFVGGVVGSVGSTVLACRATLKLSEELPHMRDSLEFAKEKSDHTSENERTKDIAYAYTQNALVVAKLYAPAVLLGAASITALSGSHVVLNRRNAGLTAAYAAVSKAYDEYRERIREEFGEEKELDYYRGVSKKKVKVEGEAKKVELPVYDPNKLSPYARIFDESSREWTPNHEMNRLLIKAKQEYFNNRLHAYGHVILNDVYEELGFEHTPAGCIVGWRISENGDNYIDFGMFQAMNSRFINGTEQNIILDFNVDGVIYNEI